MSIVTERSRRPAAYMIVASKCFQTDKDPTLRERLASIGAEAITRGREWTIRARLKPEMFATRIQMDTQRMAGCTAPEIATIAGHSQAHALKIRERYLARTRSRSWTNTGR